MTRLFTRALATAAVGIVAGALAQAAPAAANTPENCFADPDLWMGNAGTEYAYGQFCKDGEWLGAKDPLADGRSAHSAIQLWHSGTNAWQDAYHCWDDTTRGGYRGWTWCNLSITDGTLVRLRVWYEDDGREYGSKVSGTITA